MRLERRKTRAESHRDSGLSSHLEKEIRERILRDGQITFAEYMELALYHPVHGYYADPARGPGSDYQTSPTLTPSFGTLLANLLVRMWESLDRPNPFTVLEIGGGAGGLARAAIDASAEALGDRLAWEFVEHLEALRSVQRESVSQSRYRKALEDGPAIDGCVFANEVLDNFPVHLFEVVDGAAQEVYVTAGESEFQEALGPVSSPELATTAGQAVITLFDGDRFEIRVGLDRWASQTFRALRRGYLVVIDYGDFEPEIHRRRPEGTLVTYQKERLDELPLVDPGAKDITAHVNFTQLVNTLGGAGFDQIEVMTQGDLLKALGADQLAASLRSDQRLAESEERNVEVLSLLAERGRLSSLVLPGTLGDHLALLCAKDGPPLDLRK